MSVSTSYSPNGFFTGVQSSVVVDLPKELVFDVLCMDGVGVFRHIKDARTVASPVTAKKEQRRVAREMMISWSFTSLWKGAYAVNVDIEQDIKQHKIVFKLGCPGFLKKYEGEWVLKPVYDDGGNLVPSKTEVMTDQRFFPSVLPPLPFRGMVKGAIEKQMVETMEDLQLFCSKKAASGGYDSPGQLSDDSKNAVGSHRVDDSAYEDD